MSTVRFNARCACLHGSDCLPNYSLLPFPSMHNCTPHPFSPSPSVSSATHTLQVSLSTPLSLPSETSNLWHASTPPCIIYHIHLTKPCQSICPDHIYNIYLKSLSQLVTTLVDCMSFNENPLIFSNSPAEPVFYSLLGYLIPCHRSEYSFRHI